MTAGAKKNNSAVEIIDSDKKETRLKEHNTKEGIVFIVIYNPPQDSRYADPVIFNYIENHVVHLSKKPKTKCCLVGDFNARSNNDLHDVQNEVNQRANKDCVVNNYGRKLTQMCKNLDFIIGNGRCGTDTCKNVSCVDYAIVSKSLLCAVSEFKVVEFHEIL